MQSNEIRSKEFLEVGKVIYTTPATADTTSIVADTDINTFTGYDGATESAGAALTMATLATRQPAARNVVMTITDANSTITAGYVAVYGIDANGQNARELLTIPGTGTATVTGSVPFNTITNATIWGVTGTAGAGDKIKIGGGNKLGLPMGANCTLLDVVKDLHAGGVIAVVPANIDRTYGTYTGTNAPGGDHDIELWYTFTRRIIW